MRTAIVNQVSLAYIDSGQGLPLLLVHGFPLDHTMWGGQIEALSRQFRVIAPDLRGFGRSDVTEGKVTMRQMADDLAALLDALQITSRVVLCGLSMGGYIAFEFVRAHAGRLRGLILCDTRASADTPQAAAARLQMADRVLREGPAPLVESMIPRLFSPATVERHPHVVETIRWVMMRNDRRGIAAAARGMAERADSTELLPQITCPTLLVVGQDDALSPPEQMNQMARAIRNSQYVEIPDAGHLAPLERPAEVNAAISHFLQHIAAAAAS